MAMKKAEMEQHCERYESLMREAESAQQQGLYRKSVEKALSAWDHIDGMMQYKRRYDSIDFESISAIELVMKYAPVLLDFSSLDRCESLLKDYRRIEKNTSASLAVRLDEAKTLMWDARRLWDHLEQNVGTMQSHLRKELDGVQDVWRFISETWEKMGLLRREATGGSYRLTLSTRLGEVIDGKCPNCGKLSAAPKAMFLEQFTCPNCRLEVSFVMAPGSSPA